MIGRRFFPLPQELAVPTAFAESADAQASQTVTEATAENVIEVTLTGTLSGADYKEFVPRTEALLKRFDKVRMVVILKDFHGWNAGALWEDLKFDMKHFTDIDRLAIVGDSKWEKGMTIFCKPFTTATVKYFDIANVDDARAWAREN